MTTGVSKLERLLKLTAALLHAEGPTTAEQLRQRLEGYPPDDDSFRRAFERDKKDLREMGVPIRTERVPATDPPVDGYYIRREDYAGADPQLEADELAALHLAATMVAFEGVDRDEAFRRLGGVVAEQEGGQVARVPTPPGLEQLFDAARGRLAVTFGYRGVPRRVEPWSLTFTRGRWYVSGWDLDRDADRRFRVDRIEGPVDPAGAATRPRPPADEAGDVRLAGWEMGDDEPVRARVRVDADQAAWAVQQVGADAVDERADDGSVVLGLDVVDRDAFRSFVLTFLEHAVILEPAELRDDMVGWLETVGR